jgi:hypothetical protein
LPGQAGPGTVAGLQEHVDHPLQGVDPFMVVRLAGEIDDVVDANP